MKRYRTIVADPPWPVSWSGSAKRPGATAWGPRVYYGDESLGTAEMVA